MGGSNFGIVLFVGFVLVVAAIFARAWINWNKDPIRVALEFFSYTLFLLAINPLTSDKQGNVQWDIDYGIIKAQGSFMATTESCNAWYMAFAGILLLVFFCLSRITARPSRH